MFAQINRNGRTLLSVAFVAAPVLLCLSAGSFALGVGLIPPGVTSWVEGIFGAWALIFFVPVYLELSHRLSETHARLGLVTTFTGLFGAVVGCALELERVQEFALRGYGAADSAFAAYYANPGWEVLTVALLGPLFPLTSILLGAGFLRARTIPRWTAVALILAGIGFPLAQVVGWEWGLKITYPLATLFWLAALLRIGRDYHRAAAPSAALRPRLA